MQTKKHSFWEVCANAVSGFIIAWAVGQLVIPLFNSKDFSYFDGFLITCIFTIVSMIRSYIWRRIFNRITIIGGAVNESR